jgi:Carboxypeptidase regulatory-like domain
MIARRTLQILAAAVCALAIAVPAAAQITTGTLSGAVKDGQGAVVPGATVTLVHAARGTTTAETTTNVQGNFVIPSIAPGTYIVRVTMDGFKTLERPDVVVSPGDRLSLPTLTIEVGALAETVTVTADTPIIQSSTGERSFTVTTDAVENLPISNRSFIQLATLAPGVVGSGNNPGRIGGGGANNVMMDGISTMDTGSNSVLLQMNVESIAEVKVLVSNYQAEYGRSSGLQITAVTKSGTNQFRGSAYSVFRDSDWYSNSKTNILNGDPKTVLEEKDLGYSIGGPIGKPGGNNKLFFFYSHEFAPRTIGNDVQRYRVPTALERAGDFSETTNNNGVLFNFIRDPLLGLPCSSTNQAGCFRDGGVLGRIPANRLYDTGLNILKMYPLPNVNQAGANYNYEITRPSESLLAWQPALRFDYQPMQKLRATFKYSGWRQRNQIINGQLPGFNDTQQYKPTVGTWAVTASYNLTPSMFLEGTYGHAQNELTGCALAQAGTGPTQCQNAFAMNPLGNRFNAGLGNLPYLFPDANVIDPSYYAFEALNGVKPPNFVDGRVVMPPTFQWGGLVANAPPNIPFPGYLNINATDDVSISLTKVWGRHTIKTGFYNTHSFKAQQRQGWAGTLNFANDANNPIDSGFGFANAALGIFSSYNQFSRYVEGSFVYNNTEGYIQDNWKVNNRLTLDYGVRLVHQQPQYDEFGQASNFLPAEWQMARAPLLYIAGCPNNANPCSGANRQAKHPITGQLLGPNSALAIGTLVPGSGNTTNGLFLSGQGISETTYTWPALGIAPRFGMAYDLTGRQSVVLRGGAGLFFDRPDGNSIYPQVQNPPTIQNLTVRYGELQTLGRGGFTTEAPPALAVFEYDSKLPSSTQWNAGVQMTLPWASALDVEYVGQHSYNTLQNVNLNAVDFGAAFLPENQDATLAANTTPGARAVVTDLMRAFRGYGNIQQQWSRGWRTFHSIQLSFSRRFRDGLSFGFNDTIVLYDHQSTAARLQHNSDGTYSIRADQAEADELLGQAIANVHTFKGNFVWDLPDLRSSGPTLKAVGLLINDWQLSGVWTASTGTNYTVGFNYQNGGGNVNLTGSPDYGARVRVVSDPGAGCSSNPYAQFNTAAFQGPLTNSVGLESDNDYLRGCFNSVLDLAIARNIRLGGGKQLQLRVDMFNAPNAAGITNRNANINLANPNDPVTATNLPYDAEGNLIASRSLPRGAGFGVATGYQDPRRVQVQIRFSF